jgi:TRAP-type transport system small permease protein
MGVPRFCVGAPERTSLKKLLEFLCGLLAGSALFAIMALTFFDVLGRKFLSNSIPGSLELTELLMVVVIFGALPLVSERGEHVAFDSLDHYLPHWALRAQAVFMNLLCAAILIGLGWLMWRTGTQFLENGETTAQLKILKAPFIYGMGVLCAITGAVHLILIATPPRELAEADGAVL